MKKALSALLASTLLCGSLAMPVSAAQNLFGSMEAKSRQAVEAAITAGVIPAGTTVYDCTYGSDMSGATIVIRYRDKNSEWIDVVTGGVPTSSSGTSAKNAPETDLAAYADRIFELVNREREKAGVAPLERSTTLTTAATARSLECASLNSLYVDGKAHTRPDGSQWFTVLGVDKNYHYGENAGQGCTADERMTRFMNSERHRKNILREDYTEVGIGCAVSEQGEIFTVQIFYRPL